MARPKRQIRYPEIVKVAAVLISRNGYKETSCQEIAERAGIHKSTFFYYFRNKEELLLRILETSIDEVSSDLKKIINNNELKPEEKLKKALDNHLISMIGYLDNVNIYFYESRNLPEQYKKIYIKKRKKYEKYFKRIMEEMKASGYFSGLDTKIVTFCLLGMLNWVPKWYKNEGSFNIKQISDIFYKVITKTASKG